MPFLCSSIFTIVLFGALLTLANGGALIGRLVLPATWRPGFLVTTAAASGVVVIAVAGFYIYSDNASVIFHDAFDAWPSADVLIEQSESFSFADYGHTHLIFRCAPSTASRLTARMSPGDYSFGTND